MISFQNLCLTIWDDIFIAPPHQYDQRSVREHQLCNGFIAPTMFWANLLLLKMFLTAGLIGRNTENNGISRQYPCITAGNQCLAMAFDHHS